MNSGKLKLGACLLAGISVSGCAWADRTLAAAQGDYRYQLATDDRGRTVRLDRTTGQVVLVDGLIDSPPAARVSRSTSGRNAAPPRANATTAEAPAAQVPEAPTPVRVPQSACGLAGLVSGQPLAVQARANVFIEAIETPEPLLTLPVGTPVRWLSTDGNWFLVGFDDPAWGERAAHVKCSDLARPGLQ